MLASMRLTGCVSFDRRLKAKRNPRLREAVTLSPPARNITAKQRRGERLSVQPREQADPHGSSAICSRLSRSLRRRACSRPHTPRCPPACVISRLVCTQPATSAAFGFRAHVSTGLLPDCEGAAPSACIEQVRLRPLPMRSATVSGRLEKSPTNSPTTDELGSSGPALLCRARALVASHVLATCATVHVTPLILSLRAWGGRVGDSQSDGGGQRSCCRSAAASLRGGLQPRCRTTQPTLNTARLWPAPLRDD